MNFAMSDASLDKLLKILYTFLNALHVLLRIDILERVIEIFPSSIYKAKKILQINSIGFERYMACPKCHQLTKIEKDTLNSQLEEWICQNIKYPHHPHKSRRTPCGTEMIKTMLSIDGGKRYMYPLQVFCRQTIQSGLENLLNRPDILKALHDKNSTQRREDDIMLDITDGDVWLNFRDVNGNLFRNDKRNIGVILNLDWFQPFSNCEHSIGALYLALVNLNGELRYLKGHIILGIISGAKEPP